MLGHLDGRLPGIDIAGDNREKRKKSGGTWAEHRVVASESSVALLLESGPLLERISLREDRDVRDALQKDSGGDQDRVLPASLFALVLLSRYSDFIMICISGVRLVSVR